MHNFFDNPYLPGAKCVDGSVKDQTGEGLEYHVVGQIRTKPGRGDRLVLLNLGLQGCNLGTLKILV